MKNDKENKKELCAKTHMMQERVLNGIPMIVCNLCGYNYPPYGSTFVTGTIGKISL